MYDLLIQNAQVLDGTGKEAFCADVAVSGGKIAAVGQCLSGGKTVINAAGLTLTPGWIDSHSHSDSSVLRYPDQKEKVEQGITFSISGQCGISPAPLRQDDGTIKTMGDFLREAGQVPQGSGSAIQIGHNCLRKAVMGMENRLCRPEELEQMKRLLREGMDAGAIGMSIGLYYMPGCYSDTHEVVELAKVVAEKKGILSAHLRDESTDLIPAVKEFIEILQASGCRGVISHHKAMDQSNWGNVHTTVAMVEQANANGADIYFDMYPYNASGTTMLARFLPERFHPKGTTNALGLLDDPEICDKVKKWGRQRWGERLDWVMLQDYDGMNLEELAALRGQLDAYETAFDVIRETGGSARAYFFLTGEEDLKFVMSHPRCMLCTDSSVAGALERYHPRLRGSFPRILGKYVREESVVTLPEMIRKFTSLPAYVYGLKGKGKIEVGADADICIFDPLTVRDCADYKDCTRNNEGLHYVIVNGEIALKDGVYTGLRAGKVYSK